MNDIDRHIVKESDGWYFWDEADLEQYGPYEDLHVHFSPQIVIFTYPRWDP